MGNVLKSKMKNKKPISCIIGFLENHPLSVLVILICFSFSFIYFPFVFLGKPFIYSDVGADTENVYYPFFHLLFNKIRSGDFSLWTFNYGLGTNILTRQSDTMSIFTYLAFVFGKSNIKYCLIWVHFLKTLLCGVFAYKYFSYFRFSVVSRIIASYLYAFNGFLMLWGQHYAFGTACICIILLLMAVEDTLQKKKCSVYIILAASYVLITSYYFAYMTLAFTAIYLILRVLYIRFTEKKFYFKNIAWILFSFLFAFLISAFAFWPSVTVLSEQSNRVSSSAGLFSIIWGNIFAVSDRSGILTSILRLFSNNLMGILEYNGAINYYEAPQYFMSSLNLFVFVMLFLEAVFSFRVERAKSVLILLSELFVIYSVFFKMIPLAFNGFVYEAYRYTFVLLPVFALGYAEIFNKILLGKLKYKKSEIIFSAGVSLSVLSVSYLLYGVRSDKAIATLLVCIFAVAVISLISLCYSKTVTRRGYLFCTSLIVFMLIFNVCFDGYLSATKRYISSDINPQNYTGHESDSVVNVISKLKDSDTSFYRVEKTFCSVSWLYADAMIENYSGISAYDSIENKSVQEFVEKVCPEMVFGPSTYYHCFYNAKSNVTVNSILGVKYVISKSEHEYDDVDSFVLYDHIDDLYVYKNMNADSIARMYYNTSKEPDDFSTSGINLMDTLILNDIADLQPESSPKSGAGVSSIYIDSHSSSHLYGTVKTDEKGYLFLSVPYLKDWKAFVDGKPAETMRADYGFIALGIPEGEHEIELKYSTPNSFVSVIISVCSLIVLLLFVFTRFLYH